MSFIGIISDNKSFEIIKNELLEIIKDKKMNILNITMQNIDNIKNIKFETIVINTNLEKFKNQKENLEKICVSAKYILLNADIELKINFLEEDKVKIITYGLNQKATITVSSITDIDIMIYLQRNIINILGKTLEVEEKRIKIKENSKLKTYEILILYTIFLIYDYTIIQEM